MKEKNTFQKKIVLFLAVGFCMVSACIYTIWEKPSVPICTNGVLDLSHWRLGDDGTVPLNGKWEFYPDRLLSTTDINNPSLKNVEYLQVPGRWANKKADIDIADRGIGTYHLIIKTNGETSQYGLKITNIRSSCRIYANGKEITKVGNPTTTYSTAYETSILPVMAFFPSDNDTIDLVIQVANWDYVNGGIIQPIYLGSQQGILHTDFIHKMLESIGIAALMIFGCLFVAIYFFSRHNKHLLFLGLVCISYTFVKVADGEKFFNFIFNSISYLNVLRFKNTAICLSIIFMGLFIRELGKDFIPLRVLKGIILSLSCGVLLLLIIRNKDLYLVEMMLSFFDISSYVIYSIFIFRAARRAKYGTIGKNGTLLLLLFVSLITISFCGAYLYFTSILHTYISPSLILLCGLSMASFLYIIQFVKANDSMNAWNQKLIQADKEKDQLLIQTSNAFKTPLYSIISVAKSTVDSGEDSGRQQKNLILISSVAARLSSLVNDIIDFQSIKNHTLRLNCRDFDVSGTIQAVNEVLIHIKKGEQVQLQNAVPIGCFYVHADEDRLHQILIHIVGNALRYTQTGFVKITAEVIDGEIQIYVMDTGVGISQEDQKNLFDDRFSEQKDESSDPFFIGMGLKISKMLAKNMQGNLFLKKSTPGEGSVFVIQMPQMAEYSTKNIDNSLVEADKSTLLVSSNYVPSGNASALPYILLAVDDEAENIKTLQEIFYAKEYQILGAYSGEQALKRLNERRDISIVLLDTSMPGMTGYEVCRRIRVEHSLYELPILLFTSRHAPEDIAEGFEAGANDFLVKPYDVRELTARVNTLLRMKESAENTVKMETAFLQSQIKPHFLYNALSTIISLCRKDGGQAENLLKDLSNYLRGSLDIDPNHSFISVKQELSLVESYIHIDKARFGERLNVVLDLDDDVMGIEIPAMIIQPIVENAVRHGLMKRISGGTVAISIKKVDMELVISVSDDGQGMNDEKQKSLLDSSLSTSGIALKNVNKRLINAYGQGLEIQSDFGLGTTVTMRIPVGDTMQKGVLVND
ncbi:hybrid sensor histidine kinase/response regulator [[Clostridium] fimetarium]|uniref:Stage 0 sporulation protein A homolog n=1 Tax=[Clostridium] fimetarium TaxID=99656 RepID=A0A1I0RNZ4_9FIRM|nr:ATP-binding protein [[Clostridium] fimetarium]SEW42956.1 Histidine kinase-, DNA gyrase B-, and HSP90-like ATPase [[Clostridium] fimetarium]